MNKLANLLIRIMTLIVSLTIIQKASAQTPQDSTFSFKGKTTLSTAYRYQNLNNEREIHYCGFVFEHELSDFVSISGPFFYGKSPDDIAYLHVPVGGILFFLSTFVLGYDLGDLFRLSTIKYLFAENIHFNIHRSDKCLVAPYISFFGLDGTIKEEPDSDPPDMLGNGAGIQLKILPSGSLTLGTSFELKYFLLTYIHRSSQMKFGYNATVYLGYTF
jgi:hypothetical protein